MMGSLIRMVVCQTAGVSIPQLGPLIWCLSPLVVVLCLVMLFILKGARGDCESKGLCKKEVIVV